MIWWKMGPQELIQRLYSILKVENDPVKETSGKYFACSEKEWSAVVVVAILLVALTLV